MFARRCCAIPDAWFEPCIPYSDNLDGIGESAFMTTGDQEAVRQNALRSRMLTGATRLKEGCR